MDKTTTDSLGVRRIVASFREMRGAWRETRKEMRQLCRQMFHGLLRRSALSQLAADAAILICMSICMAFLCAYKEGGLDLYMSAFLPMFAVLLLMFALTEALGASRLFTFIVSLLILTGIALQTLLKLPAPENVTPSNTGLVLYAIISVVFALLSLPVLVLLTRCASRQTAARILNECILLVYLFLLVFGRYVNQTKAWIYVGSHSFQMTEVTKALSLLAFALEFTCEELSPNQRLRRGMITLLLNLVFLLIINEFGTLCVILAGFVFMAFLYLPSLVRVLRASLVMGVLIVVMLLGCRACYNAQARQRELRPDKPVSSAVAQGARIYSKFKLRTDLIFHPESVDANNGGYQSTRARNAILLSDWLGSSHEVYIPVVESDYIFDYLLLRMGVLFGILVLLLMLGLFLDASLYCLRNPCASEAAAGTVLAFCLAFQSILAAASATGQFFTVGIPFAFLAHGGSSALVNYTMVIFILYTMRRHVGSERLKRRHPREEATL